MDGMTPSRTAPLVGPSLLLALFALGGLAAARPLSGFAAGMLLALLGLRIGVMASAIHEPSAPRPVQPGTHARGPALHANG
jgi:hypothetical protein